jgi:hypothetical protein
MGAAARALEEDIRSRTAPKAQAHRKRDSEHGNSTRSTRP